MAIQKNFVVKNGIEVNDNLIFADKDQNTVGIGTTITPQKLQVSGGIGATSLVLTDSGTIPTLHSTNALISNGYINVGVVTSITGVGLTYTSGNFGTVNATTGNIVTGVVTSVSGTNLTYTNANITTLNSGVVLTPNLYAVSGLTTNGTITNLTGTAATIGTVKIAAGIITSSSGIVTYYGDGTYLNLANNPLMGIGIGTTGGVVGYGVTFLDLKGAGISTTLYNDSVGIATIFFEGGGGGGGAIGIGSTFPGTPLSVDLPPSNGDLFFHIDYARTFIYYDEVVLGVGSSSFWIDASPFNQGLVATLAGVAFSMGSANSPSAYFESYPTTGWFSPTGGQFSVVSVGNTILNVNPNGIVVTGIVSATSFSGGSLSGGTAVFADTTSGNLVRITQAGTGNALIVDDQTNPDASPFVITGIGSVGIGTDSPSAKLDVFGTIRAGRHDAVADGGEIILARSSNNDDGWAIDVHSDRFRITDIVQASSRFIISPGGNVGIGSDATSKLHVFGNANITGVTTIADVVKVGSATTSLIVEGSANITGVTTIANVVKVGGATTSLIVEGSARVTGILTVGSSSVTIDGSTDNVRVGSAVTINTTGVNVSGVVTATSFRGDGSQLTGVGGAAAVTVLTTNTTLTKGNAYMINAPSVVLTLPASPSTGDAVDILNNVSGIHTLARNGSTIMSIAEDMTFGEAGLKFKVWYTGSTWSLF